ncbi:helix-turn-helix DNA-binding domain protein [Mycobacterium phage Chupacabra]|uniref:HTH binding domain protein n=3 Tax=Fromanvirus goose TaxID=1211282 RepID=A0A291AV03_9CAUD|nr:HTH DNA binding protein [Mycobacterium phage Goose]AFU20670.1 HTH DNA binding protein [Mycobacterium phage Goose]ATE84787.1 HTH binding domain protein [Mycobacterium phage OKCentral2016]QHB41227.1 helix-turn-helix DNA-binding domain protein [Mycobacterium phage Chupacabra]
MADTNTIQVTPAAIAKAIDDVLSENERLRAEVATLRSTQSRASDLFGEAFVKGGQLPPPKGPNRPNAPKLSRRDAEHIRDLVRAGNSRREVARAYDINPATVSRIVRGTYYR